MVEYTEGRYDMILGRELPIVLVLHIKFSENVIIDGSVPYEGWFLPMFDKSNYEFKYLTDKTVKP